MLTRSEIVANAALFSKNWANAKDEDADAKSFWDALFLVFGTPRKNVATFEQKFRRQDKTIGFIDLLWKGKLIVEHKSFGKSLADARKQAQEYVLCLKPSERPEYLIACDFQTFQIVKQADGSEHTFKLADLSKNIDALGFIGGFTPKLPSPSIPVNIKAVELLGDVYDTLMDGGYPKHELAPFLVRLLFALFADSTGIFDPDQFRNLILDETKEDGSDLGATLSNFFEVLDTPPENRQAHLPMHLKNFPFVNGALFAKRLPNAAMNAEMRTSLLKATEFKWSDISPAIFGSLFQSVMEGTERRALGAHYTSEDDILKVIQPLFLSSLQQELEDILHQPGTTKREAALDVFHQKLSKLRFLDPACGCGNFLIVAYRELRQLETKLLVERHRSKKSSFLDVSLFVKLNVDMMYGIEIEEFPSEIAKVGMWLMDHICNTQLAAAFGKSFTRLPLRKSATILCGNALTTDWNSVSAASKINYVIGNPPFKGKKEQTASEKEELRIAFGGSTAVGNLDYVCAWYAKAANYIRGTSVRCAFVSTNSVSQGEQVATLWKYLLKRNVKIDFAHRAFTWKSEARGAAHVHVVIIGFSSGKTLPKERLIFDYSDPKHIRITKASEINPYLVDAPTVLVQSRKSPISRQAPNIAYGSMMIDKDRKAGDDEGLVFSREVRKMILKENADLKQFIRPLLGGREFINNMERFCLWAPNGSPLLKSSPTLKGRIEKVKAFRASSNRKQTKKLALTPYRFGEIRQPTSQYILIPKVSSERRLYVPIGFVEPTKIASGSALIVTSSDEYTFGILHSAMHNAWMRAVAGRMKSDYQYSSDIVYNTFCWPSAPTKTQVDDVRKAAREVLKARALGEGSLAYQYDPNSMPDDLVAAHRALDRKVDACYRKELFGSEMERIQFLFRLYDKANAPLRLKEKSQAKAAKKPKHK